METVHDQDLKCCIGCEIEKPRYEFYRDRSQRDGHAARCKPCHSTSTALVRDMPTEKRCPQCGVVKPRSEYSVGPRAKVMPAYCRPCTTANSKAWANDNLDEHRARRRRAWASLRDRLLAKYGRRCAGIGCQVTDARVLQLDHVRSDGADERRKLRQEEIVRKALYDETGAYQLLCCNCNYLKKLATPAERSGRKDRRPNGSPPLHPDAPIQPPQRVGVTKRQCAADSPTSKPTQAEQR